MARAPSRTPRRRWLIVPGPTLAGILGWLLTTTAHAATTRTTSPGAWQQESAAAPPAADSVELRRSARNAQRRFERIRRQLLPWAPASGRPACDETVGRFCFWHDEDPFAPPRPETSRIVHERNALIAALDSTAALLPGDPWIAGQRMRYLIESRRYLDARWAVRACRAEEWWCDALAGYALHVQGEFAAADSAFDRALASMPEEQRCKWEDLAVALDGDIDRYLDADCAARDALNRRIWRLADPLYLTPGNERRTEHFARIVLVSLLADSDNTYGLRWGWDNRELLIRYGSAVWFERERPYTGVLGERSTIVGHHAVGSRRFLPPFALLDDPRPIQVDDWELEPERPRSRYAPGYATEFELLDHQLALFPRGDSAVIVTAFDVAAPDDPLVRPWTDRRWRTQRARTHPARAPVEAGLAFVPDGAGAVTVLRGTVWDSVARLGMTVPAVTGLLSVEVLAPTDSSAARARYHIDPAARFQDPFSLSDLLVIAPGDRRPRRLEEAGPLARGATQLAPGEPVDLFWEMPASLGLEIPTIALTVIKVDKGFLRRAVEFLGFADSDSTAALLEWEDLPPAARLGPGRFVSIRIPEDEGRYVITLDVRLPDGRRAQSEREIEVRKRG